jgi:hypothetical protein
MRTKDQVRGNVLLDTGARHISIDETIARQLGLEPRPGKEEVYGLGGKHSLAVYNATLFLPVEAVRPLPNVPAGASFMLSIPSQVHGVVGLREALESQGIPATNGDPVIGILGRTFLQFTRVTYDGLSGSVIIEIDETAQYPQRN